MRQSNKSVTNVITKHYTLEIFTDANQIIIKEFYIFVINMDIYGLLLLYIINCISPHIVCHTKIPCKLYFIFNQTTHGSNIVDFCLFKEEISYYFFLFQFMFETQHGNDKGLLLFENEPGKETYVLSTSVLLHGKLISYFGPRPGFLKSISY